jgi:hypothetical protein
MLVHSLKYSLKVWLATGLIPPVIILVLGLFKQKATGHVEIAMGEFLELSVVLGLAFSLPSALLLWLLMHLLSYYHFSLRQIKTILIAFAIAASYFSFVLLYGEPDFLKDSSAILLWMPYVITVSSAIAFFPLKAATAFPKHTAE